MSEEQKKLHGLARKWALWNAIKFKGKANPNAVLGKILQEMPAIKDDVKSAMPAILSVVKEVNALSLAEQEEAFSSMDTKNISSVVGIKKERGLFYGLVEDNEKVVTAFPPEPSKYPHIGHAKAILLNHGLAKEYDGTFILRFEDTNPALAKKEFYGIHLENYAWLGIIPDKVQYASDHMDLFLASARKLAEEKTAYVCTCSQDEIKAHRFRGEACDHVESGASVEAFENFLHAPEGSAILRLHIDMKHKNSAMRDPAIMRIMETPHCRTGTKYRIWPTYDFENSIMDGHTGITHRLRSKEFELRNELQRHIQSLFGFTPTKITEFARFNMEGVESSGRKIRELIEQGKLSGWDDPSLTTLVALRRRGFQPQAIRDFVLSTGITKAESVLTWHDLEVQNRRILDEKAERYFFIRDPVKIRIVGAPEKIVELKKHPSENLGTRRFRTGESFFLTSDDVARIEEDKLYRLMDLLNFKKKGDAYSFVSDGVDDYRKQGTSIFHWLPDDGKLVETAVLMPDHQTVTGLAESGVADLKEGSVIQFERFGFVRLDARDAQKGFSFWFTHK
ncbi:MAG: glutamate--tRNA ligase [DPANN group archaeon]|nr:glutamate--tRNA ligase [DPANN group archaeon]